MTQPALVQSLLRLPELGFKAGFSSINEAQEQLKALLTLATRVKEATLQTFLDNILEYLNLSTDGCISDTAPTTSKFINRYSWRRTMDQAIITSESLKAVESLQFAKRGVLDSAGIEPGIQNEFNDREYDLNMLGVERKISESLKTSESLTFRMSSDETHSESSSGSTSPQQLVLVKA